MHKHRGSVAAAVMAALIILAGFFAAPAYALTGDADTISIPVSVTTEGEGIPEEAYVVRIDPLDDAPAPESGTITLQGKELSAGTYAGSFELSFKDVAVGKYRYEVRQVLPGNTTGRGSYDEGAYALDVAFEHPTGHGDETRVIASIRKVGEAGDFKYDACAFTNRYADLPEALLDPPVEKRIAGDEPQASASFTFVLEALDGAPLPEGAKDGKIEATVEGAGSAEFGICRFGTAGVYTYRCYEKAGDAAGYAYDRTVYTMRVAVRETVDGFVAERTIESQDGRKAGDLVFTNTYSKTAAPSVPGGSGGATAPTKASTQASPDTSDANPASAMQAAVAAGIASIALAVLLKDRERQGQ